MGWSQRKWLNTFFFTLIVPLTSIQAQKIVSAGVFTGFTIPLTIDQGINADARYQARYDLKWMPIGVNVAVDFGNYGILVNPGIASIGQNFFVANSVGGQVGLRRIKMLYMQVPVGVKIRLIDLSFFRVSMTGAAGPAFLLNGSETISHQPAKLIFPPETEPALPPDYIVAYDGVIVPYLSDAGITQKGDYKTFQLFGALGLRSDWDVTAKTRVSIDLRSNFGFLDTRRDDHIKKIKNYQAIYDIYGKRHEVFVSFTVGVSRVFEVEQKKGARRTRNRLPAKRRRR